MVASLPLPVENFPLGVEPVLFVLAGFTTTAFIQLIGSLSNPVLCWDGVWHDRHPARRAFRAHDDLRLRLFSET